MTTVESLFSGAGHIGVHLYLHGMLLPPILSTLPNRLSCLGTIIMYLEDKQLNHIQWTEHF